MTKRNPNAGPSGNRAKDWSVVYTLLAQNLTVSEIANAFGVTDCAAGAWLRRRGLKAAVKSKSTEERYGCSNEEARRLNGGAPLNTAGFPASHYRLAWRQAAMRGIAWEFTFPEWMRVWQESGKFHLRGRGADGYCMARHGDIGPYRADNVSFITVRQNSKDRWVNKPFRGPGGAASRAIQQTA